MVPVEKISTVLPVISPPSCSNAPTDSVPPAKTTVPACSVNPPATVSDASSTSTASGASTTKDCAVSGALAVTVYVPGNVIARSEADVGAADQSAATDQSPPAVLIQVNVLTTPPVTHGRERSDPHGTLTKWLAQTAEWRQ